MMTALVRKAAQAYVVGPELHDAVAVANAFAAQGAASTICFWDGRDDTPRDVATRYADALREMAHSNLDTYLSIKAPSLGFDAALLAEVLDGARGDGITIHFDSLGPETVDPTFRLIEDAHASYPRLGCTLPGRWRRSPRDAEWAARLDLSVRVVKGQWPDTDARDADPRGGFLKVVDALAGSARRVAVATHDPVLAAAALARLQSAGTPCELELLFGLPSRAAIEVARRLDVPVRYYLPYGHAWLPYALRQARRNPRILWWVLRDAVFGRDLRPSKPAPLAVKSLSR